MAASLLPHACNWPGCVEVVRTRFCQAHQRQVWRQQDAMREPYSKRRPPDWAARRRAVLERDPICKICNRAPSTHVDHIVDRPRDAGTQIVPEDALENLRGTCASCHSRKTMRQHVAGKVRKR